MSVSNVIIALTLTPMQFWIYCRDDLRKLKRNTMWWDYIMKVTEQNQVF
ncbi:hypothetical protein C8K58_116112 [Pseudomonas sp. GV047]|nr:hypothetical protein C8K58_116112 [Pseudomonas sp. GV047]